MSTASHIILFVDDEELTRKYFALAFGDEFSVLTADSAAAALAVLARSHEEVAVLITDQRMPVQRGVDLLRECHRLYPDVVRLLITAHASLDDAVAAVNQGEVYRYLTKPWDETLLRTELRAALSLFLGRRRERELLAARRDTLTRLAASVAHEMRTPLASIGAAAGGIRNYLPVLLQSHDLATAARLEVVPIRPPHRRALGEALDRIEQTVHQAHAIIDLLLMNAKEGGWSVSESKRFSMRDCVEEALASYPFPADRGRRVRTELDADFSFHGSDVLMVYVLYNLLRNALYALEAAGRGEILIRLETGADANRLRFRDSGTGIPAAVRGRIFEDFYSSGRGNAGTGMGLAFCSRVIESFGGRIDCESEEGRYTEFTLRLPHATTFSFAY